MSKQCKSWVVQLLTFCSNPSWLAASPHPAPTSDRFHTLDNDKKGEKRRLIISPIIATCNPRECRRNEAINSKKDLSGCALIQPWLGSPLLSFHYLCQVNLSFSAMTSVPIYSFQGTYHRFHFVSCFSFFWLLWSEAAGVGFIFKCLIRNECSCFEIGHTISCSTFHKTYQTRTTWNQNCQDLREEAKAEERTGWAPESTEVEAPRPVGRSVPCEENAEHHGAAQNRQVKCHPQVSQQNPTSTWC